MRGVNFRIDHRDGDVGAPDYAMDIQHLELLEDVLRRVALLAGVPRRRGRLVGGCLVQVVDVVRLHDCGHADIRERSDGGAGVLPSVIFRRTTVEPELVRLSDAMTVRPSRRTAACSWSAVMLLAICTTTSSLIMRVSVAGGISTILAARARRCSNGHTTCGKYATVRLSSNRYRRFQHGRGVGLNTASWRQVTAISENRHPR